MRRSTPWKHRMWLSLVGVIALTLTAGWWLGHRARSRELDTLRTQIEHLSSPTSQGSVKELRSENDDLIHFIDEAYALLRAEGIHLQLDLEVDQEGHYRLRADTAQLTDELKAKLRELEQRNGAGRPN